MKTTPYVRLLIETSREYGRGLLRGIGRYAESHGPWMMDQEPQFYLAEGRRRLHGQGSWERRVDGVILREQPALGQLMTLGIPMVVVSYMRSDLSGVSRVMTNDAAIGEMAALHFLERGMRNFAYLGYPRMFWSDGRGLSYAERLRREGHRVNALPVSADARGSSAQAIGALADWIGSLNTPLALFCCNDDRARQAAAACKSANLSVPDEVAMLGVDDDEFMCKFTSPPISSIRLALDQAGYEAAESLDRLMRGRARKHRCILVEPTGVSTRLSTDVLAVEDAEVAKAVRFINDHAREPIEVEDVVRATHLSRRSLYNRFRDTLGRGVHEVVVGARLAAIERALIETRQSVNEIAMHFGFSSPGYFCRFLKTHKGMTPSEFRRRHCGL